MIWNFDHLGTTITSLAVVYGINILGAIIVAFVGRWLAGVAQRLMQQMLVGAVHTEPTVAAFLASLAYYTVLVLTFLLILQVIGIQATSLVAVAGAISLAIGLALQGTLANLAAGVMLMLFRPFRLGDSIEVAGKSGVVRGLNLFMTELAGGDNVQILIPNGQVWGAAITNVSTYATRHVGLTVAVPPSEVARVVTALRHYVETEEPRALPSPGPSVSLANITDKGIEVSMSAWAKASDAGDLKASMVERFVAVINTQSPSSAPSTLASPTSASQTSASQTSAGPSAASTG